MNIPDTKTVAEAIRTAPTEKAAGGSGITNEMVQHLDEGTLAAFTELIQACIAQRRLPTQWKEGSIYCIPKVYDWSGDLNNIRLLTLLEHARKILFSILTSRLSTITAKHEMLKGNNFSVLKGTIRRNRSTLLIVY